MAKGIATPDEAVMNKIYQIREHKVMLDRDLAELYGVKSNPIKGTSKTESRAVP